MPKGRNFLNETIEILKTEGKEEKDVLWVGYAEHEEDKGFSFSWDKFKELTKNFKYDSGYGSQYIDGIVVVGNNWWLERHEYDGSEWWEFKTIPLKPKENKSVKLVKGQWNIYFKEVK